MTREERDRLDKDEYAALKKHPIVRNPFLLWLIAGTALIFVLGAFLVLRS